MTARFETRQVYEHPVSAVIELLNDPDFLAQKARDFGATEAKATARTEADGTVVAILDVWEPAHFPPGKGTSHRTLTQRTNPTSKRGTWTQVVHGLEDRSKAEGTTELVELGPQRCELINRGSIEIRVPLLGKTIEKKICAGVEAGSAKEQRYIAAALDRRFAS
ncbi:MAG: DUF2505 family protein [Enhygromyxa sp.]